MSIRIVHLLEIFTKQNLFLKYRRSYLGLFWGMVNPLFMISTTSFIFSSILHTSFRSHFLYVFSGMIAWYYLNQSIFAASNSYLINEGILRKVKINLFVLPISSVLAVFLDNFLLFILLVAMVGFKMGYLSFILLLMVPAYLVITFFCFGVSLMVSIFSVYFRDMQWLINMLMQTIFFLTPVLYKPERLDGFAKSITENNPLGYFVMLTNTISDYQIPSVDLWGRAILFALFVFILGLFFYNANKNNIIFRL